MLDENTKQLWCYLNGWTSIGTWWYYRHVKRILYFCNFIETVSCPGIVKHFYIHARQAILTRNISPTDNRNLPSFKCHYITHKLVHDFTHLIFSLNGGVVNLQQVLHLLDNTPSNMVGCRVGRAFAANPWHFSYADPLLYNNNEEEEVVMPW